jgi:hypothetical protein
MHNHVRAVLAQLTADERKAYDREPALSWLYGMAPRLARMSIADAAALLRLEAKLFAKPPAKAAKPAADREAPVLAAPVAPLTKR